MDDGWEVSQVSTELRLFNVPSASTSSTLLLLSLLFSSFDFGDSILRTARGGGGGGANRFLSALLPTLDDGDASLSDDLAGGLALRFFRLGGIGGAPLLDSAPETTIDRTLVCMANVDRPSPPTTVPPTNCHFDIVRRLDSRCSLGVVARSTKCVRLETCESTISAHSVDRASFVPSGGCSGREKFGTRKLAGNAR